MGGLCRGYTRGYIGMMEKKLETTLIGLKGSGGLGFVGFVLVQLHLKPQLRGSLRSPIPLTGVLDYQGLGFRVYRV